MMKHLGILLSTLWIALPLWASDGNVVVDVKIKPAGTFQATTSKVKGRVYKTAEGYAAENVLVDLRALETGISLRDKHMKEKLMVEKYPIAQLLEAKGSDGKGTGTLNIKGHHQKIEGTYKIKDKNLEAKFKLSLADLGITGIRYMSAGVADDVMVTITVKIDDQPRKNEATSKKKVSEEEDDGLSEKKAEKKPKKVKYDTDEE